MLGFPCNQFGAQEPGSDVEIHEFATTKFDVNFPMFSKIEVNGDGACELYQWLRTEQSNEDGSEPIPWNFTKFVVNREGNCVKRLAPTLAPEKISPVIAEYL